MVDQVLEHLLTTSILHGAPLLRCRHRTERPLEVRVNGRLVPMTDQKRLMQEDTVAMAFSIMNARQKQRFKEDLEIDIAYSVPGLGRFRCNVFQQRGALSIAMRVIPSGVPTVEELGLAFEDASKASRSDTAWKRRRKRRHIGFRAWKLGLYEGANRREAPGFRPLGREPPSPQRIGGSSTKRAKPLGPRLEGAWKASQERL